MDGLDNARAADVAVLVTPEQAPDDVLPQRCTATGSTARARFMACDRPKGHSGDHWDSVDDRYWRLERAPEQVPA